MSDLAVHTTDIPGLLLLDLPVHGDRRGWFKENWQREKMLACGLPDFGPVQHNVSYNEQAGVTRGVHAEPWDKYVSVATGEVFGAWVDLRDGDSFGRVVTARIDPGRAVFVPRGVGNAYQTLVPATAYTYLVNDHWSPAATQRYTFVNVADAHLGIDWPVPLEHSIRSDADLAHPPLAQASRFARSRRLILGANGQVGQALLARWPEAIGSTRAQVDLADPSGLDRLDLDGVDTIVNAAAYTAVDAAQTPQGRRDAWEVNVAGLSRLVQVARRNGCRLVHLSSDYVFDGEHGEHTETEPVSPLGVYGQTKAAGDAVVATYDRHFIVRTSWVVGSGANFVATMASLADRGISPQVVHDQTGRLSFATDIAAGIDHLLESGSPYGTYNLSNSGPAQSWADIAAQVFRLRGRDAADITPVSTQEYGEGRQLAPRPRHSTLDLSAIRATGFDPAPAGQRLAEYVAAIPPH